MTQRHVIAAALALALAPARAGAELLERARQHDAPPQPAPSGGGGSSAFNGGRRIGRGTAADRRASRKARGRALHKARCRS